MPELATHTALGAALEQWAPAPTPTVRRVGADPALAFAALLDMPSPVRGDGDPLPPLWHWFTLVETVAQRELGVDGRPAGGAFLPPIPGRRRMFAGGRLRQWAPIPVGAELTSRASLANVRIRSGRSGEMAFVTVREELLVDGHRIAAEEKDLVYRSETEGARPRPVEPPRPSGVPDGTGEHTLSLAVDPVVLFRFSALSANAHRIHYDLPYATKVEGYPGLVVHGPLLALLALELPRIHRRGEPVRAFDYRLVQPVFAPADIVAVGSESTTKVVVGARGCKPSLTATVGF